MATVVLQVANPTDTDVTVNAHVAKANRLTNLSIDNTTSDVYGFLASGCAVSSTTGSTFQQREQEGWMLEFEGRDHA